jgi:hypothetical protein
MAGYLDHYGAGEERREKAIRTLVIALVVLLVAGGSLYFVFKNYRQERQVKQFFELLAKQEYQPAYSLWGCSEAKPCRDYPFPEFYRDWGPQSGKSGAQISKSRSCGSGVIVTVHYPGKPEEKLWVEREGLVIGFSPWPGCPAGR